MRDFVLLNDDISEIQPKLSSVPYNFPQEQLTSASCPGPDWVVQMTMLRGVRQLISLLLHRRPLGQFAGNQP